MTSDLLRTSLGPITLRSPLVAASGTFGSVVEFARTADLTAYGAVTAKSVAPGPWEGRPPPRIAPTEAGMLNGIGIQNPGVSVWVDQMREVIPSLDVDVWGSAVAHDVEGFAAVAEAMTPSGVTAIEVNLSCPNLDGSPFALDPDLSAEVIAAVRRVTALPVSAKLSADARPIADVAAAVVEAGADWLVVANTVMGAAIDPVTRRPALSGLVGGYSGTAIRPITVRAVLEVSEALEEVPIVACGGVSRWEHAVEYALAGADAVAIGTAHFSNPKVASRIDRGLRKYLSRSGGITFASLKGGYVPW